MGGFRLNSSLISKAGQRERLVEILLKASKLMESLVGCDLYNVTVSLKEPNLVFIYEEWSNEGSYLSSLSSEIKKNLFKDTKPMISGLVRTKSQVS